MRLLDKKSLKVLCVVLHGDTASENRVMDICGRNRYFSLREQSIDIARG